MSDFTLVTDLTAQDALAYFREPKHYIGFELPPYFDFGQILLSSSAILNGKDLPDVCVQKNGKPDFPCNYPDVNYVIVSNKDGGFAWRPMQIIHPILYIDLVNLLTEKKSWLTIQEFFNRRANSYVECISLPLKSNIDESNKAVSVSNWWDKIEQESLRKSLDFKFMFTTDISNCYPSIYTHSLEWALCNGGRLEVKAKRARGEQTKNLGTAIDIKLRNMNQGQTIGIPQGSELMNFIAEIVLGGTDLELTTRIKSEISEEQDFKILRYRDDYRIFSEDYVTGHKIMKILNEVLYNWNMKMNTAKTSETSDIITSSIKPEKLEEIYTSPHRLGLQKTVIRIYQLSKRYPNSGLVAKNLTDYFDMLTKRRRPKSYDYEVVIAIMTMIAHFSPKYMPQVAAIISKIIEAAGTKLDRKAIIDRIVSRYEDVPNTEFIDIWLQRITSSDDQGAHKFNSAITKVALGERGNEALWNSDWLARNSKETINVVSVSNLPQEIMSDTFSPIVGRLEFELYRKGYDD